jgi:hypothetical protein
MENRTVKKMDNQVAIESETQLEVIQNLSAKLRSCYVFPETSEKICLNLQKHFDEGDYTGINEGEFFAFALTTHLQEVNHDEHLWVRWHPEALPEEDTLRQNPEWQAQQRQEARDDNFGITKVERLPGNIGYVDIRYFHRAEWGGDTVTAAMNFLANTSALIIDLRKCTGGYPDMIALICSYLFGQEPIHLFSIYWRDEDATQPYWTLPGVPGKRLEELPVYVLTSKVTFSAAEELASILQTRKRAILVGDPTDGGAHPGASYRIHSHFEAFIPIGRAFNPVAGKDLEGIGIQPDIALPQEHAFSAAYDMALKVVLGKVKGLTSPPYQRLTREVEAALKELETHHKICPKCGYPNALYKSTCKNCDEPLAGV